MREIAEGIYYEGAYRSGNVGCVQTREGAVLVDTPMLPNDAWDWLKKTAAGNREGIAFLINTDYHLQRGLGNCYFPAPSIAHQRTWIEIQRYDESYLQRYFGHRRERYASASIDLSKARIVLPELAVTNELTVHKGERTIKIIHVGGHTPASIVVHLPEERVLFAGDVVVNGEHPALGQANSMQWLHALETIDGMDNVDVIVPGCGDVCDRSVIQSLIDYINAIRAAVQEQFVAGATRRETVDKVKMDGFFPIPAGRREEMERRIRSSVERLYDEFKKEKERRRR